MKAKKLAVLIGFLLHAWGSFANAAELTIRLEDPPPNGFVIFSLFDSANTFGDLRDPVKIVKLPLDGREAYNLGNITPGEYALLAYFDENNNDRLDKNFIGIPKESLGFSNRYQPKGPPSYSRALFKLKKGENRHFDVTLYRPLGDYGRLGLGLGLIARSSPYRDYSSGVFQVIPAITYNGERFQVYGPYAQFGLVGSGKVRLAATGNYRIGVYEEDESLYLKGMGDRKDTFMAGLSLQAELPRGVDLSVGYTHDILDEIGGGTVRLELKKSFQLGIFRLSPTIAVNWLSSELSNHDFGVPTNKATLGRPAYDLDDTFTTEGGLGLFIEITRDWLVVINASMEILGDSITDSPIVSEDNVFKGFAAINYVF